MKIRTALIEVSAESRHVANAIQQSFDGPIEVIDRKDVALRFADFDAFIFVCAMGICVRTIAPHVDDKHTDPAVICVDSGGRHVISVLSGHVGGANKLAHYVAGLIGAEPVITTMSDVAGLWALDTLGLDYDWQTFWTGSQNEAISAFVNREPTALVMEVRDRGTDFLERTLPAHVSLVESIDDVRQGAFSLLIVVSPFMCVVPAGLLCVQYVPRMLSVGVGLAHNAPLNTFDNLKACLAEHGVCLSSGAVCQLCTIDLKAEEPVLKKLLAELQPVALKLYTSEELSRVDVPTPSPVVARHVGTPSVSEAAALLASGCGRLVVHKVKGRDFTVAVAVNRQYLREGHIEIVGAGPGAPDLVSVRGRRMLERADLILYAGSLVPRELTDCHKPGAVIRSSASMTLEEQCELMKRFYDRGKFIRETLASSEPFRSRWLSSTATTCRTTLRQASLRSLPLLPNCAASLPFPNARRPSS